MGLVGSCHDGDRTKRLPCCVPKEGGREGSGQASYCVPGWGRHLAWQFPVRYPGSVRTSRFHVSHQKEVCTCEGGLGADSTQTTPTSLIPAPQEVVSKATADRLLSILPCLFLSFHLASILFTGCFVLFTLFCCFETGSHSVTQDGHRWS